LADLSVALQVAVLGYGVLCFSALIVVWLIVGLRRVLTRKGESSGESL